MRLRNAVKVLRCHGENRYWDYKESDMRVMILILIVSSPFLEYITSANDWPSASVEQDLANSIGLGPPPCKPGTWQPRTCHHDYVTGNYIMVAPTCERYSSWEKALADPVYKQSLKTPLGPNHYSPESE